MDLQLKKEKFFHQENVKISIVLDNYCIKPEGFLEGSIILVPKLKENIKLLNTKLLLALTQYEFFEYINSEKEPSNKPKEKSQQHKEVIFNKEAQIEIENNTISSKLQIPIKVSMPKNEKLLPTFNLKNKDFIAGIRHIFTVSIPEINAITSIGIIISELNEKEKKENNQDSNALFKNEQIYKMGLINKGKISYCIRTAKKEYKNDENIDIKIMIDSSGLQETKIKSIKIKLQRKIIILGYTVNSDFRYKIHEKVFEKNETSKYELEYSIPKVDDNNFSEKEIEQYIHFNENIVDSNWANKILAPTLKGYFFTCEYKIKVRTNLNSSLITTKKMDVPILLSFSDDYFNKIKLRFLPEEYVKFGSFILIPSKDDKKEKNNNDKEEK